MPALSLLGSCNLLKSATCPNTQRYFSTSCPALHRQMSLINPTSFVVMVQYICKPRKSDRPHLINSLVMVRFISCCIRLTTTSEVARTQILLADHGKSIQQGWRMEHINHSSTCSHKPKDRKKDEMMREQTVNKLATLPQNLVEDRHGSKVPINLLD